MNCANFTSTNTRTHLFDWRTTPGEFNTLSPLEISNATVRLTDRATRLNDHSHTSQRRRLKPVPPHSELESIII